MSTSNSNSNNKNMEFDEVFSQHFLLLLCLLFSEDKSK